MNPNPQPPPQQPGVSPVAQKRSPIFWVAIIGGGLLALCCVCSGFAAVANSMNQQGGGGSAQSSECQGCVRDGDDCVWISQSNWGKGAYSGAVTSCDPKCCQ